MRTIPVVLLVVGLLAGCGSRYTDEQASWARRQCAVAGVGQHDDGWDACVTKFEKQAKTLQDAGLELK